MTGRLHAVQKGIKTDSKSTEAKTFLFQLMDILEKVDNNVDENDMVLIITIGSKM